MADPERFKPNHVGAPAVFKLTMCCQELNRAFGGFGAYLVGSSLVRADWRDVDVRYILEDDAFDDLFPGAHPHGGWELDSRWIIMCASISEWLKLQTGLPVDFQFQPQTYANKQHPYTRHALGMILEPRTPLDE